MILFLSCKNNSNNLINLKFKDTVSKELNDSINANFLKGVIKEKPVLYINGEKFYYNQDIDTVTLPFNNNQFSSLMFLNGKLSMKIYGKEGENGAIVMTTNE